VIGLALAVFLVQAGFHGFTASLPVALARAGTPDPEIGLIVGSAALVQVPAAFAIGALVDRSGGSRLFVAGSIAYLVAVGVLLLPTVEPGGPALPFFVIRLFQGIGAAAVLPSALWLVPGLVAASRRGFGLSFIGSAHNLTLVVMPPLSLVVLGVSSLKGVAAFVGLLVAVGLVVFVLRPAPRRAPGNADAAAAAAHGPARRVLGFAWRPAWALPLLVILLYVAHWGLITAYLPQRAEAAGADIGLFFAADALAVLLLRLPTGWLADRVRPILLVVAGIGITAVALALLLLPITTPILVVAGIATGGGAGLVLTTLLLELTRRSTDADRGSAFALFSAALAGALVLGSIGAAPVIGVAGFSAALAVTLAALGLAVACSLADRGLLHRRVAGGEAAAGA
jgi:MFS family permease